MACYFSSNRSDGRPRSAATDLATVECVPESVKPIAEYLESLPADIALFGCSPIELLYLRGNGEDIHTVDHPETNHICMAHFDFLLEKWPNNDQVQRSRQKGKMIIKCSLHHESPRAVLNKATIRKEEVINWMARTGELVHVGSPICSCHRAGLQTEDAKTTISSLNKNVPPKRNAMDDAFDSDFNFGSIDLGLDDMTGLESESDNEDLIDSQNEPTTETRDQISSHFSAIAELLGSKYYPTKSAWNVLSNNTKGRKVSLVLTMVQMLCSFVAPGYETELTETLTGKLSSKKRHESDNCSNQVLSAIGEKLLEAPNRRTRIETLALIVDLPFFCATKVLLTIPTVTKYLIHKARIYNCGGINFEEKYTKVRYNEEAVDFFVSFVVRSNAVIALSWLNNFATKSDGSKVEMGASVRLQSYIPIDRMYREELRKYDKPKSFSLSYGTVYMLLSSIVPRLNRRMTCVDDFLVDALEARGWARLQGYVKDLAQLGYLTTTEECDLDRRVKLAKSFLESSYRSHIELSSNTIEHCATLALSDSDEKKKAYRQDCDHDHSNHCEECREVDRVLSLLGRKISTLQIASKNNDATDKHQLERMDGMTAKCINYIKLYKSHLVRAVVSDTEKSRVQASLGDNEVLITADWAQKVLPQAAIEPQSGYFAKKGMSVHICHVYARIAGKYYHHGMNHVFDCCKQQSSDVASIFRHLFGILKTKGITKMTLRSDNAACYKSADLIGDLFNISNDSPQLDRYIYSEAQAGKGPCDRGASHIKRKIREHTAARKNARDGQEVFDALTKKEPVKGTSTYLCVTGAGKDHDSKSTVPDISTIYDISFETDGILARRHCGIGPGLRTPKSKLKLMNSSFTILKSGGYLDDGFWVELKDGSVGDVEEEEEEPDLSILSKARKDFECSTPGCLSSFLKLRNLEIHEIVGNHKFKPKKKSLLDYTIDSFNRKMEVVEVAQEARANDSFVNSALNNDPKELKMGWALKVNTSDSITDKAYDAAASYFMTQRSMIPPRRAEPRAFSQIMEDMTEPDGAYKFRAHELLTEKQLTGLFSRLETKRVSGVSVARKKRGRQPSKSSRKRAHPASSEDDDEAPVVIDGNPNGDDDEIEMDEEDLIRDCIRQRHNDIFI